MEKRQKNRNYALLALVALLLAAIVEISEDAYKRIPCFQSNVVTIGVFSDSYWDVQNGYSYQILEDAIDLFEKENPGIRVDYVSGILKEDYSEWLSEQLLLGTAPDVFFVLGEDFNEFAEIGALRNLTSLIDQDEEFINGLRAGLMGPVAGIGDSLIVGTLIPILIGIALGMSTGGSPLGAIFYIVVWNLLAYIGMRFLYFKKVSNIPARVQRRWVRSLRVSRFISLSNCFSRCLAAVSFRSATYRSCFSFSNFSLGIGSTPFAIMGKTKATNFLQLIAFGLVII